jgi:hypothetical protein
MNTGATAPVKRESAAGAPHREGAMALFAEIGAALLAATLAGAATPGLALADEAPAGAAFRCDRGVN